jgi:hypothetical protein
LTSSGNRDAFLVKYNSCGVVQWAIKGGSSGEQDYPYSMAIDAAGNVYWVGRYNQTFTINGTSGSFTAPYTSTNNVNHQDGFLVKLNSAGAVVWGASCRGTSNDGFNGIALDNSGNPIVTGGFNGCCPSSFAVTIFGPNGSTGISSFGSNYGSGLIVKFDANGNILWKGSIYNRDTGLASIALDDNDNIYMTTNFRSWSNGTSAQYIDANGSAFNIFNPGIGLGCIIKLNANGVYQWGQSFGNVGDGVGSLTQGSDVAIDANGNPWICGYYKGNAAVFYSTNGQNLELPAAATYRGFLAQFSPAGVPLQVVGHETSTGDTYFYGLARGNGKWGVVGTYSGQTNGGLDASFVEFNDNLTVHVSVNAGSSSDDYWHSVVHNGTDFVLYGGIGGSATIVGESVTSASAVLWNRGGGGVVTENQYTWSTGLANASITLSPDTTTTYSCVFSDGTNSCTDEVTITVTPGVTNAISATISEGETYALGTQTLTTAGTYTEVFTSASGCDSTVTLTLAVEPLLTCNISAPVTSICEGESVTLSMNTTGGAGASSQLPANLQQGLVAYYPFNGNANDESGNGNDAVNYGAVLTNGRLNNSLGAYDFSLGDYMEIASSPTLNISSDITLSVWAKFNLPQGYSHMIWHGDEWGAYDPFSLSIESDNNIQFRRDIADQVAIQNDISQIAADGDFHLYVASYESASGIWAIYVDSDLQETLIDQFNVSYDQSNMWTIIGGVNHFGTFQGVLDDILVHNRALSPSEIQQLYTAQSYAWNTGETTSSITVTPSTASNYSCTVTSGSQTCTASVDITVTPQQSFYADADGDGFGDANNVVQDCNSVPGYVSNANDCNDAEGLAFIGAVDVCDNGIDEDCSGTDSTCVVLGCTDVMACNYNASANTEDSTCTYPSQTYLTCDGICINDSDVDGVCDEIELAGCTDSSAFNYNILATNDDGSCEATLLCDITSVSTVLCEGSNSILTIQEPQANQVYSLDQFVSANPDLIFITELNGHYYFLRNVANLWASAFEYSNMKGFPMYRPNDQQEEQFVYSHLPWKGIDGKAYWLGLFQDVNASDYSEPSGAWYWTDGTPLSQSYANWEVNEPNNSAVENVAQFEWDNDGVKWNDAGPPGNPGTHNSYAIYELTTNDIQSFQSPQSSCLWSTGATTPSITVSPTETTTYTATVTTATQSCTDSITITVNPLLDWYADADGDGFGDANNVVQDCNQPAGFVADNTDCNDEDTQAIPGAEEVCDNNRDDNCDGQIDENCTVLGCTDPSACNFDPSANTDDGSCILLQPEICDGLDNNCNNQVDEGLSPASINAVSATTALYPVCVGNSIRSANLNNGVNSAVIEGNGNDLWYSFTAQFNTFRAGISAATGDNDLRIYTVSSGGCLALIETEHENTNGNQTLLTDQLTVGQTYYVAVHNISGPMNASAKICFNHLNASSCDHYYSNNTGIYNSVCNSFKAQYRANAVAYTFEILSAAQNSVNQNITPWSYTTPSASTVVARLGTLLPANQGTSPIVYTMRVPVLYSLFDAAGNFENLYAQATATCTTTLNAEPTITLRSSDRCPNNKSITSTIAPDRTVCGAVRYDWEFTQVLPTAGTAQVVQGGAYASAFFLSNIPGVATGKTYNVRVRPVHSSGIAGNWGAVHCLRIGAAGMILENHPVQTAQALVRTPLLSLRAGGEMNASYSIYPNPTATGSFVLQYNEEGTGDEEMKELVMMDITGKVVFKTNVVVSGNAVEVKFGDLASGVYVVMVGDQRLRLVVE